MVIEAHVVRGALGLAQTPAQRALQQIPERGAVVPHRLRQAGWELCVQGGSFPVQRGQVAAGKGRFQAEHGRRVGPASLIRDGAVFVLARVVAIRPDQQALNGFQFTPRRTMVAEDQVPQASALDPQRCAFLGGEAAPRDQVLPQRLFQDLSQGFIEGARLLVVRKDLVVLPILWLLRAVLVLCVFWRRRHGVSRQVVGRVQVAFDKGLAQLAQVVQPAGQLDQQHQVAPFAGLFEQGFIHRHLPSPALPIGRIHPGAPGSAAASPGWSAPSGQIPLAPTLPTALAP